MTDQPDPAARPERPAPEKDESPRHAPAVVAADSAEAGRAERRAAAEIDPGARALVVAVLVLVVLGAMSLPHTGSANGWEVLAYSPDAIAESVRLPSRVFVWLVTLFSALASILALVTRRWSIAWIALAGSAVASVYGMFAVWSRQTSGVAAGPGIGLYVLWIAVIALTFHWAKVVWARSARQLQAEQIRRQRVAEEEERALAPRRLRD